MNDFLEARLDALKHWHKETGNPLDVWEAVALSSTADPPMPIPEWCLPYLATTAKNITKMKRGYGKTMRDAPRQEVKKIAREEWGRIKQALPSALGFASEAKKNAFAHIADAAYVQIAALDAEFRGEDGNGPTVKRVEKEMGVTADRAKRLIKKGRKLNGEDPEGPR